jgi:hypothetical protein
LAGIRDDPLENDNLGPVAATLPIARITRIPGITGNAGYARLLNLANAASRERCHDDQPDNHEKEDVVGHA